MHYAGFAALLLACLSTLWGVLERRKGQRIIRTPFRPTGDVARTSLHEPSHDVSCEGRVHAPDPVLSPCSGTPCLYWEIEVVQHWRKPVMGENGVKDQNGRDTVVTERGGVLFYVDDGTGPVAVDPRQGIECELTRAFDTMTPATHGDVAVGAFRAQLPPLDGKKRGTGVEIIEKIVPAGGSMFVLGPLYQGCITNPIGSPKGRTNLLATTKRNMMIGFIGSAVMLVPGIAFAAMPDGQDPPAATPVVATAPPPPALPTVIPTAEPAPAPTVAEQPAAKTKRAAKARKKKKGA
jgi:hypothetical protein